LFPRHEMMDLVVVEEQVAGIVTRNLLTGEIESHLGQAVILATGGYGNIFYLSTNAMHSNASAAWRCYKKGAFFANPCFTQIHPTCIPRSGDYQSKLTLLSESLRNDGRIWVPKQAGDKRPPENIPEGERDYYLERVYPSFGNLTPRDLASRQAKFQVDAGKGVGPTGEAVYLDFKEALGRKGKKILSEKYGNLFQIYEKITGENPYEKPMRIYPAVHYTMGGLWVDYNLESTIKGLFVLGEANFSDHGANRLGASALMQGLADGYFIIPRTIARHLVECSSLRERKIKKAEEESVKGVQKRLNKILQIKGNKTAGAFHRELGYLLWEYVGMLRSEKGLVKVITAIRDLKNQFWKELFIPGEPHYKNAELEKALRVDDFLELAELLAQDALERKESCGSHFREEYQSVEQEALRDDENFCHVSVWEHTKDGKGVLHKEALEFKEVPLSVRSYK
ncbi:MAG: succinate dehydrogenase (quinone) flavoprotein subunit, partial [Bdellovibrionales bacterium]|nr:succinate dehydrogenase (quinone) flavoprotein subunit [Bdellovibrionales bacterium]